MHAAHIGIASASHSSLAPPLAMGWTKGSSAEGLGWNWAKAVGATDGNQATAKSLPGKQPDSENSQDVPTQTISEEPVVRIKGELAAQKLAVLPDKKLVVIAGDKSSGTDETKKHMSPSTQLPSENEAKSTGYATDVVMPAMPVQVAVAPVTTDVAKSADDDKGKEKGTVAAAKRASTVPANVTGDKAKVDIADANGKSSNASADGSEKIAPAESDRSKLVDVAMAAQPASHPTINAEASNVIAATVESCVATHKPLLPTTQIPLESRSTGAPDADTLHTISVARGQLEVGVLDGTHGWLSIRTEMGNNGAVNALLTSGVAAHDSLRESIPAMAGYLASEQVNVDRIAVGATADSSFAGSNLAHSGEGGDGRREPTDSSRARTPIDDQPQSAAAKVASISASLFGGNAPIFRGDGIGSWLNVTA